MTLAEVASVVRGRLVDPDDGGADVVVRGPAFVDSRAVEPGGLFVAVPGARVDGHDFAAASVRAGAAAYLGSRAVADATGAPVPGVLVDEPVAALGLLARHVVDSLRDVVVLALTGSQGKTGTKDYLAQVLAGSGPTVATAGNLNNEIGVPLTVLRAVPETSYLVVEMGARGVGHVAELCAIAPPDVAAVLNVGTAHVGEFGSRELIAQAKGEIVEALPPDGTAVLNADDPLVAAMAPRTRARVVRFGRDADVAFRDVTTDLLGRPSFLLGHAGRWLHVDLRQPGLHQVENAAAAAAMALAAGVGLDDVVARLAQATPASRWRMELHERSDGLVVVNDAYNANPESMKAAVATLADIGRGRAGRTVAVLGEMLELGEGSVTAHQEVGAFVGEQGIDVLVTVGSASAGIAAGAESVTAWRGEAVRADGRDEALAWVRQNVSAADAVLVKASRGAALEHIADGLLEEGNAAR